MKTAKLVSKLLMTSIPIVVIALDSVSPVRATNIVSPNYLATQEGPGNNGYPFNLTTAPPLIPVSLSSQRYQQVYAASDFAALSGPQLITKILFRPDATFGQAFSTTLPNVQIDLSTTSKAPDHLSTTFADNVGNNDTIVFAGPLQLSSADTGPADGPKNFDIVINLLTPFLYNPTAGNLLLDVRNFSGGTTTQFDSTGHITAPGMPILPDGDSVSRVFTRSQNGVNDLTGNADSLGLVTEFVTTSDSTSIPESGNLAGILLFGTFGFFLKKAVCN